jgi:hypothetical protein
MRCVPDDSVRIRSDCIDSYHTDSDRIRSDCIDGDRKQRESPGRLDSGASLRSSLATLVVVLASAAVVETAAPFIPTRTDWPISRCGWE